MFFVNSIAKTIHMYGTSLKYSLNFTHNVSSYFQAGDLFSLEDLQIIQDLRLVLTKIREIISAPDFGSNHNDQSLVEICITRITSGKCPFELIFV